MIYPPDWFDNVLDDPDKPPGIDLLVVPVNRAATFVQLIPVEQVDPMLFAMDGI